VRKFWRWLWSEHYSETAKCVLCGDRKVKTRMYYDAPRGGWFCSEEEFRQFWWDHVI
jgi:hypothetical protein